MHTEFTIGQFSRLSRISIKALRHYHSLGLIVPSRVDADSGYRFYRPEQLERAQVLVTLKDLGFGLEQIGEVLTGCDDDEQLVEILLARRALIDTELKRLHARRDQLDALVAMAELSRRRRQECVTQVERVQLPEIRFVGKRITGTFDQMGRLFRQVAWVAGRHICGSPMGLFYDGEYKEQADFEAGFPVKRDMHVNERDISCRVLPAVDAICISHTGPYDTSSGAWSAVIAAAADAGWTTNGPGREIYVKGPGMIFRGNPKRYITKICVTQ